MCASKFPLSTTPVWETAILPALSINNVIGMEVRPKRLPKASLPITMGYCIAIMPPVSSSRFFARKGSYCLPTFFVHRNSNDRQALFTIFPVELHVPGNLQLAASAPGRPEVQENNLPLVVRKSDLLTGVVHQGEIRCGFPVRAWLQCVKGLGRIKWEGWRSYRLHRHRMQAEPNHTNAAAHECKEAERLSEIPATRRDEQGCLKQLHNSPFKLCVCHSKNQSWYTLLIGHDSSHSQERLRVYGPFRQRLGSYLVTQHLTGFRDFQFHPASHRVVTERQRHDFEEKAFDKVRSNDMRHLVSSDGRLFDFRHARESFRY